MLTIGFARRAATYKRADLLFDDLDRLKAIAANGRADCSCVYAGKAHPQDQRAARNSSSASLQARDALGRPSSGVSRQLRHGAGAAC